MSRAVLTLQEITSSQATIGLDDLPSGVVVMLVDSIADDLVNRGLAAEVTISGTAVIASGTATIAVVHGLGKVPAEVHATGQHSEVSACWITATTSSGFSINVASNTTGNRSVYWGVR